MKTIIVFFIIGLAVLTIGVYLMVVSININMSMIIDPQGFIIGLLMYIDGFVMTFVALEKLFNR